MAEDSSNQLRGLFEGVFGGLINAHLETATLISDSRKRAFLLHGHIVEPPEDRTKQWKDIKGIKPFSVASKIGSQLASKMTSGKDLGWQNNPRQCETVKFLFNESGIGMLSITPKRDEEIYRRERIVDCLRVMEIEYFKIHDFPINSEGWIEFYSKVLACFDPNLISPRDGNTDMSNERYPETRWLRAFAFGYLLAWHEPGTMFNDNNDERCNRMVGLFDSFCRLPSEDRNDIFLRLVKFDGIADINVSTIFFNRLAIWSNNRDVANSTQRELWNLLQ